MDIIYVHTWKSDYLKTSIELTKRTNSWANVWLLTDNVVEARKFYSENINYCDITDFNERAEEFEKIYKHLSKNTVKFELFCLKRWFILLDFIKKNNIEIFFHMDSDVLLLESLDKFSNYNADFNYVMICWHNLLSNAKWLEAYCDFIWNTYNNNMKILEEYHEGKWHESIQMNNSYTLEFTNGDVSDMTLLNLFVKSNPKITTYNMGIIDRETNAVCDNCILESEWFSGFLWMKRLFIENWKYFWKIKWKKIQFLTLHCQWVWKRMVQWLVQWKYYKAVFSLWWKFLLIRTIRCILNMFLPDSSYEKIKKYYIESKFKKKLKF